MCPAVLIQAFLAQEMDLVRVNVLVKQSHDHLTGNHSLSSLCQVDKSCFCCCSDGRCCRSMQQFAHLKAMRSPWVWTANYQNRLLVVLISCSSYKTLPLCWVQKRMLWLGSWCGRAVCRAELIPLLETNSIQLQQAGWCAHLHLLEE